MPNQISKEVVEQDLDIPKVVLLNLNIILLFFEFFYSEFIRVQPFQVLCNGKAESKSWPGSKDYSIS